MILADHLAVHPPDRVPTIVTSHGLADGLASFDRILLPFEIDVKAWAVSIGEVYAPFSDFEYVSVEPVELLFNGSSFQVPVNALSTE